MLANVEVVTKVINHYVRTFRKEVRFTQRKNIQSELRSFFSRSYPGSSITRSEAITKAREEIGIDLTRFKDVQVGTVVVIIDDIKYSDLNKYTQYRLGSIGKDEDNGYKVVNGVEERYTTHLFKGEYIPLEMFKIIKRQLKCTIAENIPELVNSARDLLIDAIKDAVTIRRSKLQSLIYRAFNFLQLDNSPDHYKTELYIKNFNQVEKEIVAEELDKRGHKVELKDINSRVRYVGVWKDKDNINRVISGLYFYYDKNGVLKSNFSADTLAQIDIYTRDEYKRIKNESNIQLVVLASQDELIRRLPQIITNDAERMSRKRIIL